jgi:hypothetical protein
MPPDRRQSAPSRDALQAELAHYRAIVAAWPTQPATCDECHETLTHLCYYCRLCDILTCPACRHRHGRSIQAAERQRPPRSA